jgi:hypothetical protein
LVGRQALLRRRTVLFAVAATFFAVATFVLAGLTFSGRLGFARPLLVVLFVLPLLALVAVVLAVVNGVRAGRAGTEAVTPGADGR